MRRVVCTRALVLAYGVLSRRCDTGPIFAEFVDYLARSTMLNRGWTSNKYRAHMALNTTTLVLNTVAVTHIAPNSSFLPAQTQSLPAHAYQAIALAAELGDLIGIYCLETGESVTIDIRVPNTHKQALKSPQWIHWQKAEQDELNSLRKKEVFEESTLPSHSKALGTKWVYRVKYDTQGAIKQYKARLVARGYEQIYGIDFDETFSPVSRLTSLRLLFALSAQLGLDVHHMDVDTAFLNADLKEEIYIHPPDGCTPQSPHNCFRLRKALYGLKQSPRAWNQNIDTYLKSIGFRSMVHESCLYSKNVGNQICLIALYVDDLIIACNSASLLKDTKQRLSTNYSMKDLGPVTQVLGCEVSRDSVGAYMLTQRQYITTIIQKFFPGGLKACRTPMSASEVLTSDMCPVTPADIADMKGVPYRQLIGCLLWLAMGTRPDIAFTVTQVCLTGMLLSEYVVICLPL